MKTIDRTHSPRTSKNVLPLFSEEYVPQTMPRILGTFDMTATYVLALFALSSAPTAVSAGPTAFIFWFISAAVFFIPCAIATAQIGVMYPHEGSLYNWTHKALGPSWSFFVGLCSWLPGPLVMAGLGAEFVQFLQGLNSAWVTEPWQQGVVILAVIVIAMFISLQRSRSVQNLINGLFILEMVAVALLVLAGLIWIVMGKPVATDFSQITNVRLIKPDNYNLYGFIVFAFIGSNIALNMGGEIRERRAISHHLLWGSLLVLICYLCSTFSILAVQGQKAGFVTFAMVGTIDLVFGKLIGNIAALFFMSTIIGVAAEYNYLYARILMAGGIDQRLPRGAARLNKNRAPGSVIIFQALVAGIFTAMAYGVVPYALPFFGKPADLSVIFYNVSQAVATIIWIFSILFIFINLIVLYLTRKAELYEKRIFPMPVLWGSIIIGMLAIVSAIANTLFYSWIAQISNSRWWYIVGGLTIAFLIISAVGSILATSEAAWQRFPTGE